MRTLVAVVLMGTLLAFPRPGRADPADPNDAAMAAALGALKQAGPDAGGALDPRLGALQGSPELQEELQDLMAAIFTELVASTDGDPAAMSDAVARGKSDPEAFANRLSPATRKKLEALAKKLEQ